MASHKWYLQQNIIKSHKILSRNWQGLYPQLGFQLSYDCPGSCWSQPPTTIICYLYYVILVLALWKVLNLSYRWHNMTSNAFLWLSDMTGRSYINIFISISIIHLFICVKETHYTSYCCPTLSAEWGMRCGLLRSFIASAAGMAPLPLLTCQAPPSPAR